MFFPPPFKNMKGKGSEITEVAYATQIHTTKKITGFPSDKSGESRAYAIYSRMYGGCECTLFKEMAEKIKSDVLQVGSSHLDEDYVLRN